MSSFTHRLLCSAVLSVGLMTMAVPASAADVKMVGVVEKIQMAADGKSAQATLKDNKSGNPVVIFINDDETLDKFKIGEPERSELMGVIGKLAPDIVEKPKPAPTVQQ